VQAGEWVQGVADAVVTDLATKEIQIWECKGGMCGPYTNNQREYIGNRATDAIFESGRVGQLLGGDFAVREAGFNLLEPGVFAMEGSRVDRSSVTRRLLRRGGTNIYAPAR
jgi:hypothetical protein